MGPRVTTPPSHRFLKLKTMEMTPEEAYKRSLENGINHVDYLIQEYSNKGFVTFQLEKPEWFNPEVIEHFRNLGYKYNDTTGDLSWADSKPMAYSPTVPFNQ